jgi:putative nucleotidyltransferase with HDIG domain
MEKEKKEPEKHKTKAKAPCHSTKFCPCFLKDPHNQRILILVGLSMVISFLLTPSFTVFRPSFQLGDIADRNIKAKRDFLIEDEVATAKKREEAVRQSPIVYELDESIGKQAQQKLETAFQLMREYIEQDSLASAEPKPATLPVFETALSPGDLPSLDLSDLSRNSLQRMKECEDVLGFKTSSEMFSTLLELRFSRDLQDRVSQLIKAVFDQGIVSNKAWRPQSGGENLLIRKTGSSEEFLLPPPYSYVNIEEARKLARMQAMEVGADAREMRAIAFLTSHLLQPNLTFNIDETEHRRVQAYTSIKPVYIQLMKHEMLVREGQRIGPEELLKLKSHEQKGPNQHQFFVFMVLFLFTGVCIWVVVQVARTHLATRKLEVRDFLFLAIMVVFFLILGQVTTWLADIIGEASLHVSGKTLIYAIPMTAGAMIASIFFGVTVSLIFSLLCTLFAGMLFGKDFGLFLYFLVGSFVAAHGVSNFRNRMIPIRAGFLVGCTNVVLIVLSAFLQDQWVFLQLLINAFFGFSGGLFAGILVTGFTPLAEIAFGYTTDIKLMELVTMDQPLLQELMVQAPGTYHHSVIVGNMAEAAAKSIGANALLAKVAAYYHDIGKIRKPTYFIENQFDCENRHEKLAPSMSSLILISHVKEGVELARQHRLGKDIIDIISQHHGKSFISFFYKKAIEAREKAKSTKGGELPPINMEDYRYPGPKPQTKEAGLVMLADVVEAACRSLTEPTPARIQGMVNRLINNIFSDGQLDECELTLKDLHQIAKHFNQILATVHHKRIEYPTLVNNEGKIKIHEGKAKSEAPDPGQREPKPDRDKPNTTAGCGRTDLKRLGIH